MTVFTQKNAGWNAHPNGPLPKVIVESDTLTLRFYLNHFVFEQFAEDETGRIEFVGVTRWRLGPTNDEGWYRGQCRYTSQAPGWGEFYELTGPDPLINLPDDWLRVGPDRPDGRQFLFYLRDETFECVADNWEFDQDYADLLRGVATRSPTHSH